MTSSMSSAPNNDFDLKVTFKEVEQQTRHVCAYFAIYNAIFLITDDMDAAGKSLPPRREWQVDLTSKQVEKLLDNAMQTNGCGRHGLYGTVRLMDQVECLVKCSDTTFPTLQEVANCFLRGKNVALVVNCVDTVKAVSLSSFHRFDIT